MNAAFLLTLAAQRQRTCLDIAELQQAPLSGSASTTQSTDPEIPELLSDVAPALSPSRHDAGDSHVLDIPPILINPPPTACLSSTSTIITSSSSNIQECRICLSSGSAGDLIQPCSCSGSLSSVHMSCLARWVREHGSLICELCGQRYHEPHAQQLLPLVQLAMQRSKRGHTSSTGLEVAPRRKMTKGEWSFLL